MEQMNRYRQFTEERIKESQRHARRARILLTISLILMALGAALKVVAALVRH